MIDLTHGSEVEKAYILVIDDDPLITRTLKRLLEKEGYFVDTAQGGAEGIKKAKSGFFHLVLCDVRMPELDGLMTIRHIQDFQKKAEAGQSGFVVITAYDSDETRKQAFQLGVSDFLQKPFDPVQFLEVIRQNLQPRLKATPIEEAKRLRRRLERLFSVFEEERADKADDLTMPSLKVPNSKY